MKLVYPSLPNSTQEYILDKWYKRGEEGYKVTPTYPPLPLVRYTRSEARLSFYSFRTKRWYQVR